MKIFIDFDDVLFNTKRFKDDLLNVFIRNGVTREQFFASSYWGNRYNLKKQIISAGKKYAADTEKLTKESEIFLKNLKKYVFSDVYDFVAHIGRENLFIISYGHNDFQEQKIKNSGLDKSFNKIVITGKIKSGVISEIIN